MVEFSPLSVVTIGPGQHLLFRPTDRSPARRIRRFIRPTRRRRQSLATAQVYDDFFVVYATAVEFSRVHPPLSVPRQPPCENLVGLAFVFV